MGKGPPARGEVWGDILGGPVDRIGNFGRQGQRHRLQVLRPHADLLRQAERMEAEGLVSAVSRFEYVTHNGDRMSREDAEEQMRQTQNPSFGA